MSGRLNVNARKLPSGSWRCRVTVNGHTRSITVSDPSKKGRAECERIAALWKAQNALPPPRRTVKEEIERYIGRRSKALSPTTVAAYRSMLDNAITLDCEVSELTDEIVQNWIDSMDKSPKYIANAYGLLTAAVGKFNVRLPEKKRPSFPVPTDEDVQKILEEVRGTDMEKAVLLAAFGTLREGEICALTKKDLSRTHISVTKSLAWNGHGYEVKQPKTPSSVRTVALPEDIMAIIRRDKYVVKQTPKNLSNSFRKLMKRMGMPYRFHDLRAYSASVRHAMGIPDQYIMAEGGWKTDSVMKAVYRRAMEDKRKEFADIAGKHFSEMHSKIRGNFRGNEQSQK